MAAKRARKPKPLKAKGIRCRVVEMRKVPAGDLYPHPHNFRTHPQNQRSVLRDLFKELGFADPIVARVTTPEDSYVQEGLIPASVLCILDGHLRDEELPPDYLVPVIVLDLDEKEGNKFIATADPLAALAEQDNEALVKLLADVETSSRSIEEMLADLCKVPGEDDKSEDEDESTPEQFQILITCADEAQQTELLDRFMGEGFDCRSLVS